MSMYGLFNCFSLGGVFVDACAYKIMSNYESVYVVCTCVYGLFNCLYIYVVSVHVSLCGYIMCVYMYVSVGHMWCLYMCLCVGISCVFICMYL